MPATIISLLNNKVKQLLTNPQTDFLLAIFSGGTGLFPSLPRQRESRTALPYNAASRASNPFPAPPEPVAPFSAPPEPVALFPLLLNLLKDGRRLFRPILRFLPPFPSFNQFRRSGWDGCRPPTVLLAGPSTTPPAPYRPSRVSGNPESFAGSMLVFGSTVGIPAYAGRTVGAAGREGQ